MNKSILLMLTAGALAQTACAWVKTTEGGAEVKLLDVSQVENCTRAGTAHVSVLDKVGVVKRGHARVADELATLAANSAAQLGGNAIVAITEIDNGNQSFAVYKCQ